MRILSARSGSIIAFVLVFLAANGCGRSTGSVSGTVSYKGEKLRGGFVAFVSTEGLPGAAATIQSDGTYRIPQLTSGNYTVTVETESLNKGGASANPMPMSPGMPKSSTTTAAKTKELPKNTPPKDVDQQSGALASGYQMSDPNDAAKRYVKIPARYSKTDQSKLTFTANGGTQTWDIALTD